MPTDDSITINEVSNIRFRSLDTKCSFVTCNSTVLNSEPCPKCHQIRLHLAEKLRLDPHTLSIPPFCHNHKSHRVNDSTAEHFKFFRLNVDLVSNSSLCTYNTTMGDLEYYKSCRLSLENDPFQNNNNYGNANFILLSIYLPYIFMMIVLVWYVYMNSLNRNSVEESTAVRELLYNKETYSTSYGSRYIENFK